MNRPVQVIFIDDDPISNFISELLCKNLDSLIQARSFASSLEAFHYLAQNCTKNDWPDIIFLDIEMPKMNGYTFLHKLRSESSFCEVSPLIIVLTVMEDLVDQETLKSQGVNRILKKPLREQDMIHLLESFVNQ